MLPKSNSLYGRHSTLGRRESNRFKGLDLLDRVPEELWVEVHDIVLKPSQRKINARRQGAHLRRLYKQLRNEEKQNAREKGKDIAKEYRVPENNKKR